MNEMKDEDLPPHVGSVEDSSIDSQQHSSHDGSPKRKVRYEPHLIKGEKKGEEIMIRGIFRMNPKYDPDCSVIDDGKKNKRSSSHENINLENIKII